LQQWVSSNLQFREELEKTEFSFIFISFKLLEDNKESIRKYCSDTKVVLLSEFGEAIPDKNLSVLSMPVYSTTISNILNGISDSFSYIETHDDVARFNAPTAKVLIVDDIKTNLKVAEGLMLPYKMQVHLSNSGREALEAVQHDNYDLIFMDHKMPDMDGVETTQRIRELGKDNPYFLNVPIVILTANAVSGAREMFLKNGFNDFLSKPIDTVKLRSILERFIPKEKQKITFSDTSESSMSIKNESDFNLEITGLDIKRGIFLSGGNKEVYLDTLAIFYRDGFKKIEEIRACLEANNIQLYTIHVHALKSASANVGADRLSGQAKELEMAGERKDLDFIRAYNGNFIDDLHTLLVNINNALVKYKESHKSSDYSLDLNSIRERLSILVKALDEFNAGTINDTIDDLKKASLPDDLGAVIGDIYEKILVSEYEEATAVIKSLLNR
jgi:CheY-like chemotaxis protein/HPt (histidine-containing phosphotransfer) domain-containing protein